MGQTTEAPTKDRRDILKGALAVAAGAAATAIATAGPAEAADGANLALGQAATNQSSTKTLWTNDDTNWMLELNGNLGLRSTMNGTGPGYAVLAETNSSGQPALGANNDDASGTGVYAQADGATAIGAHATSNAGTGLKGRTQTGTAVLAVAEAGGVGLDVQGPALFSRSGHATVGARKASVKVTGQSIDTGTMVLAVLQQQRAGVWVTAAVPAPAADTFTIFLNKSVGKKTKVAWFLLG
ncbi:MAG: twin-arginine translocation signal domain-containing protein [Actinomycetota bacterium]